MAAEATAFAGLLWLAPAAKDLLRNTSKILKGDIPCPPAKLAKLVADADATELEGLLADAAVRASFVKKLEGTKSFKELSNDSGSAQKLVEVLGETLKELHDAIKKKAGVLAKILPTNVASIKDLAAKLPKGTIGEAVKLDWGIWHGVGSALDTKALPMLPDALLKERLSLLLACDKVGAFTDFVVGMHVNSNMEAYVLWELSIPAAGVPKTGAEVLSPLDKNKVREVATRRVVGNVLPLEIASAVAAVASKDVPATLEKLVTVAKKETVIPMYTAPAPAAAPKETKAAPAKAKSGAAALAPAGDLPAEGTVEAALTKLDFRVGRIVKCETVPDSDKLFLLDVNIGEENTRQVITGLQKNYKAEELRNRLVFVYANIKPGKLAGYESQAMVCTAIQNKGEPNEICKLLDPPPGSKEGTRTKAGSVEAGCNPATLKNASKYWREVQPLLVSSEKSEASFNGTPLLIDGKPIKCGGLKGASIS